MQSRARPKSSCGSWDDSLYSLELFAFSVCPHPSLKSASSAYPGRMGHADMKGKKSDAKVKKGEEEKEEKVDEQEGKEGKDEEEPKKEVTNDVDGKQEAKDTKQEEKESEQAQEEKDSKQEMQEGNASDSLVAGESSELKPTERDVILDNTEEKGNLILIDFIRLHYILLTKDGKEAPQEEKDVDELASRLMQLMLHGKKYELAGLKDVPKPFLKGTGRFWKKNDGKWVQMSDEEAKDFVSKTIISNFKAFKNDPKSVFHSSAADVKADLQFFFEARKESEGDDDNSHSAPRPCDVLFLPVETVDDNMPYEHQSGNKHILFLASQYVAADTNVSEKRIEAALRLVTSKVDMSTGTEVIQKTPRYVIQHSVDNQNSWREIDKIELVEFAVIFVFEVYLEKQIHASSAITASEKASGGENTKPSDTPIENPTPYDVLFGRGGRCWLAQLIVIVDGRR